MSDVNPYQAPAVDGRPSDQVSGDGRHCPACGQDIGVVAIVRAGLPNQIYCPHCRTRLEFHRAGREWAGAIAVFLLICVPMFWLCSRILTSQPEPNWTSVLWFALAVGVGLLVTWLPVEIAIALHLRRRKRLKTVGRR